MKIRDIVERNRVMPHTAEPMGLIHKPGYGPNNRYGFKNHSNNRANETLKETYVRVKKDAEGEISQYAGRLGRVVDQDDDGDYLVSWGDNEGEDWIEKKNLEFLPDDAYWNPDDEDEYAKGTDGEVATLDPEFEDADRANEIMGFATMRPKKTYVVKKRPPEKDDKALAQKVQDRLKQYRQDAKKEDAAGVGIVTKQNATKDVPVGGQYMNVKKLKLDWKEFNENFADGKKKGKSRPGRVKRSGASCKGSVTSLRSKAKKASGERAKMYHWCANMKSGRKK